MAQIGSSSQPPEESTGPAGQPPGTSGGLPPGGGRSRKKLFLIIGASVLVVVVAVVAIAVFLLLGELRQPGEVTAQYLPGDTQMYFNINLRPGARQLMRARKIISIFKDTEGFLDRRDDLLRKYIEDLTGIDVLNDVLPWLGKDITFALLEVRPEPEWVVLVQTKDRSASKDFLEDLIRYLEDEQNMEFSDDTYKGALIFTEEDDEIAFGVTDDYVIFASGEDVVQDTITNLDEAPERNLSKDKDFLQLKAQLPDERFMLFFVRSKDIIGVLDDQLGIYALADLDQNISQFVALSGSFIDKGLRLEIYADTPRGSLVLPERNDLNTAKALPEGTLAMLSIVGIPEVWKEFRRILENLDSYEAERFDEALEDLNDQTGIDLERDIIEELKDAGEITLAMLPSDLRVDEYGDFQGGAIHALLLAEIGETRRIQRALDKLMDFWEDEAGVRMRRDNIGKYEAVTVDLGELGGLSLGLSPGYLFTKDMLVLGTTEDALSDMANTLDGKGKSLKSAARFSRLAELAPNSAALIVYADIAGIVEMVLDALPRAGRSDYNRDVRPLVEPLDAFFAGLAVTKDISRFTLVLTVREP